MKDEFDKFIKTYYYKHLKSLALVYPKKKSLIINFKDVERFNYKLADFIIHEPMKSIAIIEDIINELNIKEGFKPNIRFSNLPVEDILIESIGSKYLNRLFSFKGLVTRRGDVLQKAELMVLTCNSCGEEFRFHITDNVRIPTRCPVCKKGYLKENFMESSFKDLQRIEVQDMLEKVRAGAPSSKIMVVLDDDLVNAVIPGDNVEVIGILRIVDNRKKKTEPIFSKYIEGIYIRKLKRDFEEVEVSREDEKKILEIASRNDIEQLIVNSIAPDIWGYEEIKRAIALQLFGGTKNKLTSTGKRIRDDIHILLIGDPGIAKTRFLIHAASIAPKSIYVGGKTVSGVGLTASAEKDELSGGGWTLKAGALVLASGGIAAIDEFDKIDEEDRAALHEVMESGTVSIAKAGMVARFKAKTSIIAAANPKFGRFHETKNLVEQFNIPPSLFSRFDLIFPLRDVLNVKKDEDLANHILTMHKEAGQRIKDGTFKHISTDVLEPEFLRKYIAYARKNVHPILTDEAIEAIKEYYMNLRNSGRETGTVPITPRYLEGLIRLSEANAKMRLSDVVERRDSEIAINLMEFVMKEIMTDRETGHFDVDLISVGKSQSEREKILMVLETIKQLSKEYEEVEISKIIEECEKLGLSEEKIKRAIEELRKNGDIYKPHDGYVALTGD